MVIEILTLMERYYSRRSEVGQRHSRHLLIHEQQPIGKAKGKDAIPLHVQMI
jgi:hypothetical protein